MVTNTKFDVEKFDGTNNFGMWQCEVQDILFQQKLDVALEENRPEDVDEKDWTRINRLCHAPNPGPTRLADPNRFPGRETQDWDS